MSRTLRHRTLTGLGLAAAVGALVLGTTVAYGALGDGPTITACISSTGAVKVVSATTACATGQTRVTWNKQGPVGPRGATGARGATGPVGPTGAAGVNGLAGAAGSNGGPGAPGQAGQDGSQGPVGPKGDPGPAAKLAGGSGEFGLSGRMTCTGAKQGVLTDDGSQSWTAVESTSYKLTSPRDPATGQATGKRQHGPITIIRELDHASPKLFQALVTNENLTTCVFSYWQPSPEGRPQELYRISLQNASVSEVTLTKGDTRRGDEGPLTEYEAVSFTFQKIEMLHTPSGTLAIDDWVAQI